MENFEDDFKKVLEKYPNANFYTIRAIKELLKTTLEPIINTILKNVVPVTVEWELDIRMYPLVVKWLDAIIFLSLTRIKEGGIKNTLKPTLKRVEHYTPEKQKKSFFGGLFKR